MAFQAEVLEHWQNLARATTEEESESPEQEDFGFSFPLWFIAQTAQLFRRHGILPEPGGWSDQDTAWCHDVMLYLRGLAYYEEKYTAESNTHDNSAADIEPVGFEGL